MLDPVNSRTLSGFPLSVGTGLALESVFEPTQASVNTDVNKQSLDISKYQEIWINLGTLFRNLYNALDKDAVKFVQVGDASDALIAEMDVIHDLVKDQGKDRINVVFYYCEYDDLAKRFPMGSLRLPRTPLQMVYSNLYTQTLKTVYRKSGKGRVHNVSKVGSVFGSDGKRALIMTHFATDLLNRRRFRELDLLESHTGKLKTLTDWYTKYYEGRDLNMLPMSGLLLPVFGDDHQFRPQSKAMKLAVLEVAKKDRWTVLSRPTQIASSIKNMRDHMLRDAILKNEHI